MLTHLGFGTAQKALKKVLALKKRPARWVPHELTDAQKQHRVDICRQLLHLRANSRDLTDRIVTRDESWVLSYDPATRQATASWLGRGEQCPPKPRSNLRTTRLMLVCFFDAQGMIHREFFNKGLGISADVYLGIMECLRRALHHRRPQMWMNGRWYLQHDGAPAHCT